jgi:HlyD family secretion protein
MCVIMLNVNKTNQANTNHMSNFFNNYKTLLISAFILLLFICGFFLFSSEKEESNQNIYSVKRDRVFEVVEVSGQVESVKSSDLSFEKSGIISSINVKIGERVSAGDTLASLSSADTLSSIREAQAGVDAALANLNDIKDGASVQDLNLKQQNLDNARFDLSNAEMAALDAVKNSKINIADIVDFKLSSIFFKSGASYKMSFNSCDQIAQAGLETERSSIDSLVDSISDLENAKREADKLGVFLTSLNTLLNASCSAQDSNLNTFRATVSGARSQLVAVFNDISAKRSALQSAKNTVARAERDYELASAPADANKIKSAEAALDQAAARLANANAQYNKNILKAPFDGVISALNIEKGELASQSKVAMSIISDGQYQISAKIAEADISKISLNNKATVTIDAYPNEYFEAVVTRIDPSSVSDNGVPRYTIILTFSNKNEKLKSGMTANADIITAQKENVLVVPASFVRVSGSKAFVVKYNPELNQDNSDEDKNKTQKEVEVIVGVRSPEGVIEVVSGLIEGEQILEIAKDGQVKR